MSCSSSASAPLPPLPTAEPSVLATAKADTPPAKKIVTIVGTNDLHGHIESTPLLGGYLKVLRQAREKDGGAVLLVDAGDMFQGTLESNLGEGVAVLHAYKALGYAAATIGNHEFDYGPVGPAATPDKPDDDPRGALKALVAGASFPMLSANILVKATGQRLDIGKPSVVVVAAGFRVGFIGVSSEDTLRTTASGNVRDLDMAPLAETITREANHLRADEHADLVIVLAHAGGKCARQTSDFAKDGCEPDGEIFHVAQQLAPKTVDAIVAGHTHQGVSEIVNGVPIIESFSYGRAFGQIDFTLEASASGSAKLDDARMVPPRDLCLDFDSSPVDCKTASFRGERVESDATVAAAIADDVALAKSKRDERLGVVFDAVLHRDHSRESEEGNLFADLMKTAHPEATVALMNGGGLRKDIPSGELTYGALYEAFPFDNKVAVATVTGADLTRMFLSHLGEKKGGILSVAGVRVTAKCDKGTLKVELVYDNGRKVGDKDKVTIVASDFMMTGGDGFWGPVKVPTFDVKEELMRETLGAELRKRKTVKPAELVDEKRPRIAFPGARPVDCK